MGADRGDEEGYIGMIRSFRIGPDHINYIITRPQPI